MFRALACFLLLQSSSFLAGIPPLPTDLRGNPVDPWKASGSTQVFLFVRTDCPITNRYAPELRRIANHYKEAAVTFWLVYSGREEAVTAIEEHTRQYGFPGTPLLDPGHTLVRRAHATVAPEAGVFDRAGRLLYHGRIDDRWISFGRSRPAATVHDLDLAIQAALGGRVPPNAASQAIGCSLEDAH